MADPAEIIQAVNARWPHQDPDQLIPEIIGGRADDEWWLLVERSTITNEFHLSTHCFLRDLIRYQTQQECAEDWEPRVIVNLHTGEVTEAQRTYDIELTTTGDDVQTYEDWRA